MTQRLRLCNIQGGEVESIAVNNDGLTPGHLWLQSIGGAGGQWREINNTILNYTAFIAGKLRRVSRLSGEFIIHTLWLKLQVMWYYWSYSEPSTAGNIHNAKCTLHPRAILTLTHFFHLDDFLSIEQYGPIMLSRRMCHNKMSDKDLNINNYYIIHNVVTTWLWNMNMVAGCGYFHPWHWTSFTLATVLIKGVFCGKLSL